jgi:two-component sensor histidine kinase
MHGDNVLLNPNGAVYVGLAFHELVVNTISHGGNLASHLPVTLHCTRSQTDGEDRLEILWEEPLSNRPIEPKPEGHKHNAHFGSVVLEKVVPAALAGEAVYEIHTDHIRYRLTFPI